MLSIRLRRTGTTKRPYYRVVVADSRAWRDGRFVEILGHYDPRRNPAVVKIDAERAQYWIGQGAKASDTVRSLLKELLTLFAQGLVKDARRVSVREESMDGVVTLELEVAPADRGRVIGRNGRTVEALRTVLQAVAARRGLRSSLEIVE